jgi:hypothetical protein
VGVGAQIDHFWQSHNKPSGVWRSACTHKIGLVAAI